MPTKAGISTCMGGKKIDDFLQCRLLCLPRTGCLKNLQPRLGVPAAAAVGILADRAPLGIGEIVVCMDKRAFAGRLYVSPGMTELDRGNRTRGIGQGQ